MIGSRERREEDKERGQRGGKQRRKGREEERRRENGEREKVRRKRRGEEEGRAKRKVYVILHTPCAVSDLQAPCLLGLWSLGLVHANWILLMQGCN